MDEARRRPQVTEYGVRRIKSRIPALVPIHRAQTFVHDTVARTGIAKTVIKEAIHRAEDTLPP
jgi:hypothetical protein